ncbi:alanine racemase 2 [Brevibacillus reuszeri]|uniref:Alanine racemase n=1 Tax=Brevibacillus reuszeri TaxID=54915 RepID=A0A0K9YL41_9BACL|nr:alanine racemase [Brevibacillus reuszeri]KNB68910.1 alanine racemase [Brevibacillus reuszeri]MED1859466.1 alanine racemase [Brevibacillus reuszeri]GED71418.1 alanine racemase 2 [Brevibacillus reuszeri]
MKPFCRDTWVEVNLDAIRANVETFRSHIPASTSIIAVVKADGYGHGSVRVGEEALASGAESLAVAMLDEAIVLREAGIEAPILVLGFTPVESVELASRMNVELTAYNSDWIIQANTLLQQANLKPIGLQIKVDTGMGRLGVRTQEELLQVVSALEQSPKLVWSGVFTHFACADEKNTTHVRRQHETFQSLLQSLRDAGKKLPKIHCCNTAAAIAFPEWGYDSIRLGIGLYGLYPSPYMKERKDVSLVPALTLKTRIAHVKTATEPMTISYGATYCAQPGEQVATLPIGYADGFSRLLSNRGDVLYNGSRAPIIGKVCMDQFMVRLEQGTGQVGDEVVLYGKQGDEEISLDEVAAQIGTINYEVPCMLNYRIPRVYFRNQTEVGVFHPLTMKQTPQKTVNN